MALTNKDTYHLLKELNDFAATIYYLAIKDNNQSNNKRSLSFNDLENLIYKDNMEQIGLVFPKLISKLSLEDIEMSSDLYKETFTKKNCIELFLERNTDKHFHLQDIRDIALTDDLANIMIKDDIYSKSLQLVYLDKLLTYLEENPKDAFFSTRETLKTYRLSYNKLRDEIDQKIDGNINQYYISTITE